MQYKKSVVIGTIILGSSKEFSGNLDCLKDLVLKNSFLSWKCFFWESSQTFQKALNHIVIVVIKTPKSVSATSHNVSKKKHYRYTLEK